MRVAVVTGSTSRKAGGLFVSVRRLIQQMNSMGIEVTVYSIRDEFSEADANLWNPVPVRILRGTGPSAVGFAPGLRKAIESFEPQLIQVHGLWKFVSLSAHACGSPKRMSLRGPHAWDVGSMGAAEFRMEEEVSRLAVRAGTPEGSRLYSGAEWVRGGIHPRVWNQ